MKPYVRRPINHMDDKMITRGETEQLNKNINEPPQLQLSGYNLHQDD